jgi:hypothetical protein
MAIIILISVALKKEKLNTNMFVCFIRENKEKILIIIIKYLKRTGKGSIYIVTALYKRVL